MDTPAQQGTAGSSPPGQPKSTGLRQTVISWIIGITLGLLVVASLFAWSHQSPPLAVARQYLAEQQGIAPDDLALVGYRGSSAFADVFLSVMTVEFRIKGAKDEKKRVVELFRPVYFLPWRVSALREGKE
jgi:hypothetical protein